MQIDPSWVPGLPTRALTCGPFMCLDVLTAWRPNGSQSFYMVVQVSKLECHNEQGRAAPRFRSPGQWSQSIITTYSNGQSSPYILRGEDIDFSSHWEECQRICSQLKKNCYILLSSKIHSSQHNLVHLKWKIFFLYLNNLYKFGWCIFCYLICIKRGRTWWSLGSILPAFAFHASTIIMCQPKFHVYLEPENVTLFENTIFVDVVS